MEYTIAPDTDRKDGRVVFSNAPHGLRGVNWSANGVMLHGTVYEFADETSVFRFRISTDDNYLDRVFPTFFFFFHFGVLNLDYLLLANAQVQEFSIQGDFQHIDSNCLPTPLSLSERQPKMTNAAGM